MNIFHRDVGQGVFERVGARSAVLMKTIALGLLAVSFAGCMGYVPGRQTYWDAKVKEMCEKDGHVQIIEQVQLMKSEAARMRRADGNLAVTTRELSQTDEPVYLESKETNLREGNPRVRRTEWVVIRRADQNVVARWFSYGRIGGDIPSPAHESSFRCPDWNQTWAELQNLFIVKER